MARAYGSRSQLALAYESTYGTAPGSGFFQMPFAKSDIGTEQPLLESELLGYGRDPQSPVRDAINLTGSVDVPVDQIGIGYWLKALLGAPTTTGVVAATGSITFSAQPAVSSTITINGTVFTFVASGATGAQCNIGANLAATMTALAVVLNANGTVGGSFATYAATATAVTITRGTLGTTGNAVTLAASTSPASNGTVSAATLTGGANSHTFISGAASLPSISLEVQTPEVPYFEMYSGIVLDKMKFNVDRKGLLTSGITMMGQGSTPATTTAAGTLAAIAISRFAQFTGAIKRNGTVLAGIVSCDMEYANNLDPVEVVRADGKVDGVDPTIASLKGSLVARFADSTLLDQAIAGTDCALELSWTSSASASLTLTAHSAWLPRPRRSIDGPAGLQVNFDWIGAKATSPARMFTAVLINQVASY